MCKLWGLRMELKISTKHYTIKRLHMKSYSQLTNLWMSLINIQSLDHCDMNMTKPVHLFTWERYFQRFNNNIWANNPCVKSGNFCYFLKDKYDQRHLVLRHQSMTQSDRSPILSSSRISLSADNAAKLKLQQNLDRLFGFNIVIVSAINIIVTKQQ